MESDACNDKAGHYTNGEARRVQSSDEAAHPRAFTGGTPQALLERMLARDNLQRAWKRVKANRGAAGMDGLDIAQTGAHLKTTWPTIREQLRNGHYRPQPVRRVSIPKANGSQRQLGIPTVTDRLIQQALLQCASMLDLLDTRPHDNEPKKQQPLQCDQVHHQKDAANPSLAGIGPAGSDSGQAVSRLALTELAFNGNAVACIRAVFLLQYPALFR